MKIAQVQFAPWDKTYDFLPNNLDLKVGDKVIVKTELGTELGEVVGMREREDKELKKTGKKKEEDAAAADTVDKDVQAEENISENGVDRESERELKPVLRKATFSDSEKVPGLANKKQALEYCKQMKEKYDLPMKFIDAHYAFDGSRITFAFIADGRIDFRELVKDLTRHFGRTIRLQQIGIRDEARVMGDYGHCGKPLCCRAHLVELSSITSEMAELQQCSHRGSDRISGICGRLMCCLAYEENGYEEMAKKMPPVGAKVNVDGKKGVVIGQHVLKQSVDVEFAGDKGEETTVVEVDLNRHKK